MNILLSLALAWLILGVIGCADTALLWRKSYRVTMPGIYWIFSLSGPVILAMAIIYRKQDRREGS